MAIEFSCRCGSRFRVEEETAGKRARCKACGQYVIIPAASAVASAKRPATATSSTPGHSALVPEPPPIISPALPSSSDPWIDRQIEQHQQLTQSVASNPGRLRISHLKH